MSQSKSHPVVDLSSLKQAYHLSLILGDNVWNLVQLWSIFSQTILGQPFLQSLDKVSIHLGKALLAAPPKLIIYMDLAFESLSESIIWLEKVRRRKLISKNDYTHYYKQLQTIHQLVRKVKKIQFN